MSGLFSGCSLFPRVQQANGGLNIASNFFLYCEDKILPNGTFVPGIVSPGCDAFTAQAKALGMGSERVIGGDIGGLRILFSNSTAAAAVIAQMAALVKLKTLTGLSWDVEPTGTTYKDALAFGRFNQQLSAAIAGSGARVSVYSNAYSSIIADIADYASSVGAVLTGETYNGKDYPSWLANYESVAACFNKSCGPEAVAPTRSTVEAKRPSATLPPKMVPAMLASTERGTWNCDPAGMKQRVDRILTDGDNPLLDPLVVSNRKALICSLLYTLQVRPSWPCLCWLRLTHPSQRATTGRWRRRRSAASRRGSRTLLPLSTERPRVCNQPFEICEKAIKI